MTEIICQYITISSDNFYELFDRHNRDLVTKIEIYNVSVSEDCFAPLVEFILSCNNLRELCFGISVSKSADIIINTFYKFLTINTLRKLFIPTYFLDNRGQLENFTRELVKTRINSLITWTKESHHIYLLLRNNYNIYNVHNRLSGKDKHYESYIKNRIMEYTSRNKKHRRILRRKVFALLSLYDTSASIFCIRRHKELLKILAHMVWDLRYLPPLHKIPIDTEV